MGSTFDNLPIPGFYEIGVGDEIRISLWGQADLQQIFVVDKEGRIFVPSIGFIPVIGKSLAELKQFLKQEFSKSYSTLYSDEDKTFMDVSMVTIQSINIQVIGHVVSPGAYNVHPFSNIALSTIVHCNEYGVWKTFETDKLGFNNPIDNNFDEKKFQYRL